MRPLLDYAAIVSRPVGLEELLAARETRALRQRELGGRSDCPVISLTLNLPGPVKRTPLSSFFFDRELARLKLFLEGLGAVVEEEWVRHEASGDEAVIAVKGLSVGGLKALALELEGRTEATRLLDMDVLDRKGQAVSRAATGLPPRPCLLCDQAAVLCSAGRVHPLEEVRERVEELLFTYAGEALAEEITGLAAEASAFELMVAPKPGLVTPSSSGSHDDMDRFTFIRSQASLIHYYRRSFLLAWEADPGLHVKTVRLRHLGLEAEGAMEAATGGVNTHRGWIYCSGILLLAAGEYLSRVFTPPGPGDPFAFLPGRTAEIARSLEEGLRKTAHFQILDRRLNASPDPEGVREEALRGFPCLFDLGLPVLSQALKAGDDENTAGQRALLALLAELSDSTLQRRAGRKRAEVIRKLIRDSLGGGGLVAAACALPATGLHQLMEDLSSRFAGEGLSCGGAADLLAGSRFMEGLGRLSVTDL